MNQWQSEAGRLYLDAPDSQIPGLSLSGLSAWDISSPLISIFRSSSHPTQTCAPPPLSVYISCPSALHHRPLLEKIKSPQPWSAGLTTSHRACNTHPQRMLTVGGDGGRYFLLQPISGCMLKIGPHPNTVSGYKSGVSK